MLIQIFNSQDMQNKVTLGYWAIRGLAERLRMLLEFVGANYEQERYQDADKWFKEDKPKLSEKNPALTLPYLLDGDKVISESDAIIVYICHRFDKKELLGRNAQEQVNMATIMGVMRDLHGQYVRVCYGVTDGNKDINEVIKDHAQKWKPMMTKLEKLIAGKSFAAGEITWVDFALADFIQTLFMMIPDYKNEYPNLVAHQNKIWQLEAIKKYHQSDRWSERPCNGAVARWR